MTEREVYLDNSATTPVASEILAAMTPYWQQQFANPSSPHRLGVETERTIKQCRQFLANLLSVAPDELFFTSGGTESNNLAIQGVTRSARKPGHIITTPVEHPSVLGVVEFLAHTGWEVSYLAVDSQGKIDTRQLADTIREDTRLVTVMHINNEVGTIYPIEEIGLIINRVNQGRREPIYFHVDGVQSLGKTPIDLSKIDLMTFSGHKIFGPKGSGLLYSSKRVPLKPLLFGGGQQGGIRPGTENVAGIVGLTKAFQLAIDKLDENRNKLLKLRQELLNKLQTIPESFVNSPLDGAPHIINLGFCGVPGEVLVHHLEQNGVYVSMGAACASKKQAVSHVLKSLGLTDADARSSLRLSLSPSLDLEDIHYAYNVIKDGVTDLRAIYG